MSAACAALALFALSGCGEKKTHTPYPEEFKKNFTAKCLKESEDLAHCECVLHELEKTVPYEEISQFDTITAAGREDTMGTREKINTAIASCKKK
jgi:hypothetical protein